MSHHECYWKCYNTIGLPSEVLDRIAGLVCINSSEMSYMGEA